MSKDSAIQPISYRHLTLEEREEIAIGLASGSSKRAIARLLNRNPSTISRECSRNKPPLNRVRYRANCAHQRSCDHQKKSHHRERIKQESLLPTTIYESIYQWIYSERRDLISLLPRAHRKRRKRGSAKYKHVSKIPNRVPIENRPLDTDSREEIGHWEADTSVSRQSKMAIAVVLERATRLVKIRLFSSKSAHNMTQALIDCLLPLPTHFRKSITYDNGSENTSHEATNAHLGTSSYFCTPYHSWEKGSIEQVIGLIRRTYPKKNRLGLALRLRYRYNRISAKSSSQKVS